MIESDDNEQWDEWEDELQSQAVVGDDVVEGVAEQPADAAHAQVQDSLTVSVQLPCSPLLAFVLLCPASFDFAAQV